MVVDAAAVGPHRGAPDYSAIPKKVMRPDFYLEAMKGLGVKVDIAEEQKITLFDGVFDGKDRRNAPGSQSAYHDVRK